jgi:DNA-directed RNA polymerase specialized sigma24 family protein
MAPNLEICFRLAHVRAARLVGKYGFSRDEAEDIGQDLLADLLARRPNFDAKRGSDRAFIRRIMENRLATIISARHARCRDYRRNFSGEVTRDPVQNTQGSESIDPRWSSGSEMRDLEIDIRRLRKLLRPELAAIAVLLPSRSPVEIVGLLGISRSTLYRRIKELRAIAIGIGLDRYIPTRSSRADRKKS